SSSWSQYSSKSSRHQIIQKRFLRSAQLAISATTWKSFWRIDMPLEVRSLWSRLVHEKFHCQCTIAKFSSRP
ncbi:hypothetical protein BCV72DRAFT_312678, partial [Rhizopus microsporus var. microsporus]